MFSADFDIPGWETWGTAGADWGMGGDTFFATNGSYEGGTDTSGPEWGGGGEMYDYSWDWEQFAKDTVTTLDPIYGEGGVLEPVTVIIDPDRTVKEEYIDPLTEEYGETGKLILAAGAIIGAAVLLK